MISTSECVATAQHGCTVWRSYTGLMTDVPHLLFELTLEILTAPIALLIGWLWGRREHGKIDIEHGVEDHGRM